MAVASYPGSSSPFFFFFFGENVLMIKQRVKKISDKQSVDR